MYNRNKRITIFTPTFNRRHTIERTYKSLLNQTCYDFVWLIIDDGSTDNTVEVVKKWKQENDLFEIEYRFKENGGMHTAHNLAYSLINTELNVCIDSDDLMPPTAVEEILEFWDNYGSNKYAGIVALDSDLEGKILGTLLPEHVTHSTTHDLYEKYGVKGDKKFIYRTEAINAVPPYPEYPGEKLVPLGYKYEQVDDLFPMLLMNSVVCQVDYQPDGSTHTIIKQYLQSPKGFAVDKIVRMTRTKSLKERLKCILHYIAECRIARDRDWLKNVPYKMMAVLLYPAGCLVELMIRNKIKRV